MAISKLTNNVKPLDEVDKINEIIDGKQDALVSGANIKTINNNSILGSGNLQLDSLPSQTGNAGKFLQTDGTDASWESAPFRNVGEIVASTIPLTDAGLRLLDGSLIQGGGVYADFVTYIAGLYTSGDYTAIFDTEANWQAAVTANGVCGKFVYDSVNNTVRLPKYSNKIYTSDINPTAPVVGNGNALGLTSQDNQSAYCLGYTTSGYLWLSNTEAPVTLPSKLSGSFPYPDALKGIGVSPGPTKSGIIAQLSNITTSLDGYYYIVVATSTKTDIQVDIDDIATDLNGKADVDLSNVNSIGKYNLIQYALANVQDTDSSKVGYVYKTNVLNTAIYAPSGGKWLVLYVIEVYSSSKVAYLYTNDVLAQAGSIVNGGTQITSARSGYEQVVVLLKIK